MSRAAILALCGLAGCAADEEFVIVTIDVRPAVHDVATLKITLSNADSTKSREFAVKGQTFPTTFSIQPTGRVGDLGIDIEAFDDDGLAIGHGVTQTSIDAKTASLLLEPNDFVVNTEYAEDQQLSNYYGANGFQLSATPAGLWTAVYNANCSTPCNVFGRRFDVGAKAVNSTLAAGTVGFPISAKLTTSFSTPAVASNATTTLTMWNADDPNVVGAAGYSIQCRALDAAGAAVTGELSVATDAFPNLVSVVPLNSGNFVATWDGEVPAVPPAPANDNSIRSAIVKPDCTALGAVQVVSQAPVGALPHFSHVAANAGGILHVWTVAGEVHVRPQNNSGTFTANDTLIINKTATEQVEFARVAPLGTGFVVVVRWALVTGVTGPGRIEAYRVSSVGAVMGAAMKVSERSGTDFASSQSFGLASGTDGRVLVVWSACNERGDGSGCGVFGRLLGSDGVPLGDEFVLATTTTNDQTGPSAIGLPQGAFATAWTDKSGVAPDSSGTAVRARVIYPGTGGGAGSN